MNEGLKSETDINDKINIFFLLHIFLNLIKESSLYFFISSNHFVSLIILLLK